MRAFVASAASAVKPALATLLAVLAGPLAAAPADAVGPPGPRSAGPLVAQLLLTPNEGTLRRSWAEAVAAGAGAQPRIEATDTVAPGQRVSAVVIFSGCAPGPAGACDLTVEYALQGGDGVPRALGSGALWREAPQTPRFMLGGTALQLSFTERDRGAQLQVRARVTDRVARRTLDLAAPLWVE